MGFFDDEAGTPALSWADAPKGTKVRMVVIPDDEGRAYIETEQTDINDSSKVLTFSDGKPRMQAVITVATDLREWERTSEKFQAKVEDDPDAEPDGGLRRFYVAGASLTKGMKAALRKAKLRDVVPGMVITVTTIGKKPVEGTNKTTREFIVEVEPPNADTLAIVAQHTDSGGSLSTSTADGDTPDDDDPPPFS